MTTNSAVISSGEPRQVPATMRVLHLSSGNMYGGIERLLVTLAHERSYCPLMEPHFGLCFDGRVACELRGEGAPVEILGEVRFSRPWTVWRARRRLRELLARERFDVVICHGCWPHAVFASTVRFCRLPLVFWAHGAANGKHWLERLAARVSPDLVLANSRYTLSQISPLFPTAKVVVCYCPVSFPGVESLSDVRDEVRKELNTPPDHVVIVLASRLEAWKGHELFLAGLKELRKLNGWTSWIAGGPQRPSEAKYLHRLQECVKRTGLHDRVRFLGQRSDVARLLAAADIYCQPNAGPEPFGLIFVEALASGLPVVTTQIGAAPEIVTRGCGVLVPPADVSSLTNELERLITETAMRSAMTETCRSRAAELSAPTIRIPALRDFLIAVVDEYGVAA